VATFRFEEAFEAADKLDALARRAVLQVSAVDAVNAVAVRFDETARRAMNQGLNLSDDYVAQRMRLTKAAGALARAEIVARGDLTIIAHYPHKQLRAAGSAVRSGRSRGRRPSGVAVEIKKGQASFQPQWFTMRLRNSGKTRLFVRTSEGQAKHLYGPSPYSLFRFQVDTRQDDLLEDLARTAADFALRTAKGTLA
jgi:hypothetical protein